DAAGLGGGRREDGGGRVFHGVWLRVVSILVVLEGAPYQPAPLASAAAASVLVVLDGGLSATAWTCTFGGGSWKRNCAPDGEGGGEGVGRNAEPDSSRPRQGAGPRERHQAARSGLTRWRRRRSRRSAATGPGAAAGGPGGAGS